MKNKFLMKPCLILFVFSLLMLFGLAACKKTEAPTTGEPTTNSTITGEDKTTTKDDGTTTKDDVTTSQEEELIYDPYVEDGVVNSSLLPELETLEEIYVVSYNFANFKSSQQGEKIFCELVTLSVLQGLTASKEGYKKGLYLNIKEGGYNENANQTWLDELVDTMDLTVHTFETDTEKTAFLKAVDFFKDLVTKTDNDKPGYILVKQSLVDAVDNDGNQIMKGSQSINAGCTIASATGYLVVDETAKEDIDALGFEMAVDARNMSEIDAYNAYSDGLNDSIIMLCNNGQTQNRDYGVATHSYFTYESNLNDSFMNQITDIDNGKYKQGTLTVGWSSSGEVSQVNRHALYGFNFTCTNYSYNLSQLARQGRKVLVQKTSEINITADPTKKYVAFVLTDGDNITWHQNNFPFDETHYGYTGNINFKMNYTMAPLMADLCPSVMAYEYKKATHNQSFICGVSGSGYIYPSEYISSMNQEALEVFTDSTDEYMRRSGISYVEILDNSPFNKTVMNSYAKRENIKGGLVLANYNYYKQGGDIKYYNGKPFIGVAESMWSDTPGRVAYRLNSLPVDITSANGYTVVTVHAWTASMKDVCKVVSLLDDNIVVVSIDEMMQLIKDNVKGDSNRTAVANTNYPSDVDEYIDAADLYNNLPTLNQTLFTFDTYLDYEGWTPYYGAKVYDRLTFSSEPWTYSTAIRTTEDGGSGYSIRFDGSDYGNIDENPNSSLYAKLKVPNEDNVKFSFFVRGEGYGYDADYRVRTISLVDGKETINVLNKWTEAGDDKWREVVYDISDYKGQDVVFIIEHNSTQREGDGEILYIDNIEIRVESLDLQTLKSAKVNSNTKMTFDSDMCSLNVIGDVTHNSTLECLEANVYAVNKANYEADAVLYTRFDLKDFSDYTHAKFGVWLKAEESKTIEARLGLVSADGKTILRQSTYRTITDENTYMSLDLDTYRIKGGAFKYAYVFIELRGNGTDSKVYLDNVSFSKYTRDLTNGYFFDKEFLFGLDEVDFESLEDLNNWQYEAGRILGNEARIIEDKVRLYGYDCMKSDDSMIASKSLSLYSMVKNEFNGRMFQKTDLTNANSISFDVEKIEKTKDNTDCSTSQFRVIFIQESGVTVIQNWTKVTNLNAETKVIDLSSISGSGILMIEEDSSLNGDYSGFILSNININ